MALTVAIRVQPRSATTMVGGSRGDALLVRVNAAPVAGKATEAALRAVAAAFGVRRGDVRLVAGGTGRDKLVRVEGDGAGLERVLATLRRRE